MTDIVERLRYYAKAVMPSYPNDVCSQAADEIERLRDVAAAADDLYEALIRGRLAAMSITPSTK
jgi:hypothetical protein